MRQRDGFWKTYEGSVSATGMNRVNDVPVVPEL